MRKRFELPFIGSVPISELEIPTRSRDELPPVLLALQTIYCNAEYHDRMFAIIEPVVTKGKSQRGREGMTVWEVIVLSVVRLTLNTNYDRLLWIANSDTYLRQLMGVAVKNDYGFTTQGKQYSLTALKENIGLLDLDTIEKVNALVLEVGYDYLKKKTKKQLSSKPIAMW
jgi:hypothetical protein